ncbi:DUF3558 family protein [Nocardia sp. CC227C]|uniref:DUF3558 family protein n=1 Tax=Nocardia sp. CC227C TaxID=3044562 RepID=UPI00278C233D|nr:DUF3558 family protein [Nocardia sp. CC227C]
MRKTVVIATATLIAGLLSGCSKDSPPEPDSSRSSAVPGAFLGECGGARDDDIRAITGLSTLTAVARNGLKCVWESPGRDRRVMFTWFRDSPVERERTIATVGGKTVADFSIDGFHGFTANATSLCQAAVQDGADFFHWLILAPGMDCAVLHPLARLTLDRSRATTPAPTQPPGRLDELLHECTAVPPDDIMATVGESGRSEMYFHGAVCMWRIGGRVDLTFGWLENGSVEREEATARELGYEVTPVINADLQGFSQRRPGEPTACGVTTSDSGAVTWWVQSSAADPCDTAERLMALTVRRRV